MRTLAPVIVAAAGAAAALWWIRTPVEQRESASTGARSAPQVEHANAAPASATVTPALPASDPHAQEFADRADFHNRVRSFFARSAAMSKTEREAQVERLDAEIAEYERARELSAGEALMLRLALVHETSEGAEREQRMAALKERYETLTGQRRAAVQPDPMFELYKAREQEIVAHVQAMETFPDGLTRDEYLRRTLQRERELLLSR